MELRHLRYFLAVAEEGHVTRAAERLGIQQPPLSQQIKAIERELQVQLFRRKPRGMELTNAGRAFLKEARALLSHLEQAVETARSAARGEEGRLCIGLTSTSPFHPLVPRAIGAFRHACPLVSLMIEECLSNESLERLRSEQLDAAFVRISVANQKGLQVIHLQTEPMMVALSSAHRLAKGEGRTAISLSRLTDETFILYGPPGTGMHDATIAACHASGFNPRIGNLGTATQQAPRITSTLCLVAAGLGVSFVPASLRRMNMEGIVYRALQGPVIPKSVLNLVSRRGDPSAVVRKFTDLVRKLGKQR